jgi:hypothetical protein
MRRIVRAPVRYTSRGGHHMDAAPASNRRACALNGDRIAMV